MYATSGRSVIFETPVEMTEADAISHLEKLVRPIQAVQERDIVLWRNDGTVIALLQYSPKEYKIKYFDYVNWAHLESMTEEEAGEMWDDLKSMFGRREK